MSKESQKQQLGAQAPAKPKQDIDKPAKSKGKSDQDGKKKQNHL